MKRRWWSAYITSVAAILVVAGCGSSGPPYNATPIITGLYPSNITAGSDNFTLFIVGSGFIDDSKGVSVVEWNGSQRVAVLNQTTGELEAQILAADVAGPNQNTAQVTVTNPAPGGGVSNPAATFTIVAQQPGGPVISSISPTTASPGGPAFTLTVNGTDFTSNDVVTWNGTPRTTTFMSATQVTASITKDDISNAQTASVAVAPSSNLVYASPSVDFQVGSDSNSMAVVSLLSPAEASQGSSFIEVTVSGSGFQHGAVVEWAGKLLPAAVLSDSELVFIVPTPELAARRAVTVGVRNPPYAHRLAEFTQTFTID